MGFTKLISARAGLDDRFIRIAKGGRIFIRNEIFEKLKIKPKKGIWAYIYTDAANSKIAIDVFNKEQVDEDGGSRKFSIELTGASVTSHNLSKALGYTFDRKVDALYTIEKNRLIVSLPTED